MANSYRRAAQWSVLIGTLLLLAVLALIVYDQIMLAVLEKRYIGPNLQSKGWSDSFFTEAQVKLFNMVPQSDLDRKIFTLWTPEKPEGVIRIGCFGDSYTWGHEVEGGADFPSQLERLFQKEGRGEIQVLNFGERGYGSHQAYLMWKEYGTKYNLDYVLFGPEGAYPHRDLSFCSSHPSIIRGRFVLKEDKVHFVEPIGETRLELFRNYHSLFPPLIFWRYDRRLPSGLARILQSEDLDHCGADYIKNPFYYLNISEQDEVIQISRKLFGEIAAQANLKVLQTSENQWTSSSLKMEFGVPDLPLRFLGPLDRRLGHHSAFGNLKVAEIFKTLLYERDEANLTHVAIVQADSSSISDTSKEQDRPGSGAPVRSLRLFHGDTEIGLFHNWQRPYDNTQEPLLLPADAALIGFAAERQRWIERPLWIISNSEGLEQPLSIEIDGAEYKHYLPATVESSGRLFFSAVIPELYFELFGDRIDLYYCAESSLKFKSAAIRIGSRVLFEIAQESDLVSPQAKPCHKLIPKEVRKVPLKLFGPARTIDLQKLKEPGPLRVLREGVDDHKEFIDLPHWKVSLEKRTIGFGPRSKGKALPPRVQAVESK